MLPISAVACYDLDEGTLLGTVRVRLIESLPVSVGRHGIADEPAARLLVHQELEWRPAPNGNPQRSEQLATLLKAQGNLPVGASSPDAATGPDVFALLDAFTAQEARVVFLECYPWERPAPHLADAVRLQAFHGKPLREDLRIRFAAVLEDVA